MADYISMKQVPGGTVTAKDDRIVYDANMADSGIIYGCAITYAGNNMIHIGAGYGIIKGGMFEMEDHTEYVDLAENEPTTGQIYLHLDLSADDKLTIVKETTNSLHPMVQNADANFTNGVYELQLCTFTATTTALEDVTQTFEVIQNQVLDTLPEIMANTTAGLKAGALALKEVSENLITIQSRDDFVVTESVVGTYLGETRYRRVYHAENVSITSGPDLLIDADFNTSYVKCITEMSGSAHMLDGYIRSLGVYSWSSDTGHRVFPCLNSNGLYLVHTNETVTAYDMVFEYTKA